MRRRWKILIGIVVVLAILLTLNTIAIDNQTKGAGVTVKGGRILKLAGGDIQVRDINPAASSASRPGAAGSPGGPGQRVSEPPIVLIHCYTCAIDWWDGMIPLLSHTHRVIAVDLLGHGGSEKPSSGYGMEQQAALVAQALNRLGVEGAVVVGHSLGATVATALASQSRELVDRLVIIDQAPDSSYGDVGTMAKLSYQPVLGEAMWRVLPDGAVKDGLSEAFAPGYDVPDAFVDDLRRMTYTSYTASYDDERDYTDQRPLTERIRDALVPALVIFGSEDQIYDARKAISAYAALPGVRTALVQGAGHSPNVEKPAVTARLVLGFAKPAAFPKLPPEKPPLGKHGPRRSQATGPSKAARQVSTELVARCHKAIIGPGPDNWRERSIVAGRFGLAKGNLGMATPVDGVLTAKRMALVAGRKKLILRVPAAERDRVRLNYGTLRNIHPFTAGAVQITFAPCQDKRRTVWPGGLMLKDRKPVTLEVVSDGGTTRIRVS